MNQKNEETGMKLAEAMEYISDDTLSRTAEAMEHGTAGARGAGKKGRSVVLKTLAIAACVCLIAGAVLGTTVFRKLIAPVQTGDPHGALAEPGTGDETTDAPRPRAALADAVPVYRSNGDGTCTVIGLENPLNALELNVTIPETSPSGDRVTAYAPVNVRSMLPRVLTVEDFESILDEIAAAVNADSARRGLKELNWRDYSSVTTWSLMQTNSQNVGWFVFNQFRAYYMYKSVKFYSDRQAMTDEMPVLADHEAVYILGGGLTDVTREEMAVLDCYLRMLAPVSAGKTAEFEEKTNAEAYCEYARRRQAGEAVNGQTWTECLDYAAHLYDGISGTVDRAQIVSLVLPDTVEELGHCAVAGYSFKTFNVPAGMKKLNMRCLTTCPYLEQVTISGSDTWTVDSTNMKYTSADVAALLLAANHQEVSGVDLECARRVLTGEPTPERTHTPVLGEIFENLTPLEELVYRFGKESTKESVIAKMSVEHPSYFSIDADLDFVR